MPNVLKMLVDLAVSLLFKLRLQDPALHGSYIHGAFPHFLLLIQAIITSVTQMMAVIITAVVFMLFNPQAFSTIA